MFDRRPWKTTVTFANAPKPLIVAFSLVMAVGIACIDRVASLGIGRSVFYLAPVCLATWYAGRTWGLLFAFIVSALRYAAHLTGVVAALHVDFAVEIWNILIGLGAYSVGVVLLAKIKGMSVELEKKVEQRTSALVAEIAERQAAEEARRQLALQLFEAEDAERTRLAADIHDSVGQGLSVLKLNLGAMANRLTTNGQHSTEMTTTLQLIDDIVNQIRTFTFEIHPAMLEDLGLVPTLHWYAERFESQAAIQVTVSEYGVRPVLPPPLATYLFRAIKELLNNAAKHGRAKEVVIGIHWREHSLRIVLDDDGHGFDPTDVMAPQTRRGLGLAGMRERLLALKGSITVESEPGHGARIILEIGL